MPREQISLRIGAVCVVVGSIAVFAFRTAHGDVTTGTGKAARISTPDSIFRWMPLHLVSQYHRRQQSWDKSSK